MKNFIPLSILLACCAIMIPAIGWGQYSQSVFQLKGAQDLYDENGFEHGTAVSVDGHLNISNMNGSVAYSYPISSHVEGGYSIDVALNYCSSVAFTAFKDYNLASRLGGDEYSGWSKLHQNRPAWIVGVNGFAVNVIATTGHFHADSASRAFVGTVNDYTDADFIWTIDGYDWSNRMSDFNPVGSGSPHGYCDVIRILRADGSLLDLYNAHSFTGVDPDTRPELYTGYYHTNVANDPAFGIVEYDSTYWPEYIQSFARSQQPTAGQRAPLVPRRLRYYTADGLEYVFREWLASYGLSTYEDVESRGGGVWGHPSIFYLEEIRSNQATIATFTRARHYPIIGNPLFQYENDETRGRALITAWEGHQLSFGYNSMMIEALGRTTQVKFDTIARSGNAESWETFPWANNGGMTHAARQLANYAEGNPQLYKSFVGYVTKIIDPQGRVTTFDYEPVTRIYEDLGFPHANPANGGGHQTITLKNYRLKSVTEPTARYTIKYNPGSNRHITASEVDPPTLNDVVDTVRKYDAWGALLSTDAYSFSPSLGITTIATKDAVTALERSMTYHFTTYPLDQLSSTIPAGRHTTITQVDDVADDGDGGTLMSSSFTTYAQGTAIPGVGTNTKYLILPTETHTTVQGMPQSHTKFRYTTDTVNRFGGDATLAGRFGIDATRRVAETCRPDHPATVLLTDTTDYIHFPLLDSVMTWTEWHWDKLATIANYLRLRDSNDARLFGKRWEDVMFTPLVAAFRSDTVTELAHMPPVYGLVRASWVSDSAGCIAGKKNTYLNDISGLAGRKIRDLLVADTILGRDKRRLQGTTYSYTAGWTANTLAGRTDAYGVPDLLTYNYYWATSDSVLFWAGTNAHPEGSILSNDDSLRTQAMSPGNGGIWYGKPLGTRSVVRKYDELGTLYRDTLESYLERGFFGLVTGTRDANGWYSKSEYDQNGRLRTLWMPGDFAHAGTFDTTSYDGMERADLFGATWYNRRIDQIHCYKDGAGHVVRDTIVGTATNTFLPDTFYAAMPVTEVPVCPCKDDPPMTKEKPVREIQQTCDAYFPYNQHAGYTGFYGVLNYTIEPDCPFRAATRIDSAFLDIAISSIAGECLHLTVAVDTLLSKTYLFNCAGPEFQTVIREKDGERAIASDQLTPIAGGYLLRVDLTGIAAQLHARPVGSVLQTKLTTATAGGAFTFVNGTSSEDLRPHFTVYGAYQRVSERADYTLAYDYDDAALTVATSAKLDDRRHTANIYDDAVVHGATVRRATAKHFFGAGGRLLRTENTVVEDAPRATRVDTTVRVYTGLGLVRTLRDVMGDTVRTTFDGFGRAIEIVNPDGTHSTERHFYDSATVFGITDQDFYGFCEAMTTTDENGVKFITYSDAFGRLRREVADSNGLHFVTRYDYDLAGNLTRIINPKGDTTRYWYDEFGRVQYKRQPDIGIISYAYDKLGRVRFVQDEMQGEQRRVGFHQYDDLGRLTLVGEAWFQSTDSLRLCNDYNEDDNFGDWDCTGPWDYRARKGEEPAMGRTGRSKRDLPGILSVRGDDPAPDRLTNRLNADTLHTWPASSIPTANPTIWMTPARAVPVIPQVLKLVQACGQLQANALLGETTAPVGPFMMHPTAFYGAAEPGADSTDFENVARHPEFVRMAIAYDSVPPSAGAVWGGFPAQWQWDALAPRGVVRNARGREAAVASRERGAEPYHYTVLSYDERGRVEAILRYTENLGFDAVYYTYNSGNQVTSLTVADFVRQYTTWYGHDGAGRIDSVWSRLSGPGSGLWANFRMQPPAAQSRPDTADIVYRYTKVGMLDSMRYPSVNVLVSYAYNHRKLLDSLVATKSGGNLFREILKYDPAGQITEQVWQQGGGARQKQSYAYDSLQRLTGWTKGPEKGSSTPTDSTFYSYDAVGNRLSMRESVRPQIESYLISPFTPEGNQLTGRRRANGLAGIQAGDSTDGYSYNPNGAMNRHMRSFETSTKATLLSEEDYGHSYRGLLRRALVAEVPASGPVLFKDWRYRYSAGGEREQKRLYDANQSDSAIFYPWVYYLLGGDGTQLAVYHGQQTRRMLCGDTARRVYMYPVEYITNGVGYTGVPEQLPQLVTKTNGAKEFQVSDHLASLRVAVEGTATRRIDYDPWGNVISGNGTGGERATFNAQERDLESGLYDLSDRNYNSVIGAFTRPDRLLEKFPSISPYAYCNANPVRLTDPNGMQSQESKPVPETGSNGGTSVDVGSGRGLFKAIGEWWTRTTAGEGSAGEAAAGEAAAGEATAAKTRSGKSAASEVAASEVAAGKAASTKSTNPTQRIVYEHLKESDLQAAKRELQGEVVARKSGGDPYDHVTEVREAQRGLTNRIEQLQRLIGNTEVPFLLKMEYMKELGLASRFLDYSKQFVPKAKK